MGRVNGSGQLVVGQFVLGQLAVGQLLVGQLLVGQLVVGQLVVGLMGHQHRTDYNKQHKVYIFFNNVPAGLALRQRVFSGRQKCLRSFLSHR